MKARSQVLLGGGLILALGVTAAWSYQRTVPLLASTRTHEAFVAGDFEAVVKHSESLVSTTDQAGQIFAALDERCQALALLDRWDACLALLDSRILGSDAHNWLPPHVVPRWLAHAVAAGRRGDAAEVARRWSRLEPTNAKAAGEAFSLTIAGGDPKIATDEALAAAERIGNDEGMLIRLRVARVLIGSHDGRSALEALGTDPPRSSDTTLVRRWWTTRISAAADAADQPLAAKIRDEWIADGGSPAVARATYAVERSRASLRDPESEGWSIALMASYDEIDQIPVEDLRTSLTIRLLGQLAVDGERENLAKYLEKARAIDPSMVSNEDELRRLIQGPIEAASEHSPSVLFRVDHPVAGANLWVSGETNGRPDAMWESLSLAPSGTANARRSLGQTPYRWVYRDELRTYASGAFWPSTGSDTTEIVVKVSETPVERRTLAPITPRPEADGNRRIWLIILDCGDWRLTSYLRQRGEMPVLQTLLDQGWRTGLLQYPAYTAAAMEALVRPSFLTSASFPAAVNALGVELGGLSSIGKNPFAPLSFLLPDTGDLASTLGAGNTRVGNLLFAHGNVQSGRNAEISGPNGTHSLLTVGAPRRPATEAEIKLFPDYAPARLAEEQLTDEFTVTAAQLDAVERLMSSGEVDVLLYRLEALDLATHGFFAPTAATKQDDGEGVLFEFYRYIDWRLANIASAIDGDDALIVMSDHGIQTSMEHHPIAMFVAWGNGIPHGRTKGYPELRGVAQVIGTMRGVQTNWPNTQVVPWAEAWAAGTTPPGLGVPYEVVQ